MNILARLASGVGLMACLAGCIDATVEVTVLSETDARVEVTQTMSSDFYPLIKMNSEENPQQAQFCEGGDLTEHDDGRATCFMVEQGPFDDLTLGEDEEITLSVERVAPGQLRVAFDMGKVTTEDGGDEEAEAEIQQMVETTFAGHTLTLLIGGGRVLDTNMNVVDGGAQLVIALPDLINNDADLPDEAFAVIEL